MDVRKDRPKRSRVSRHSDYVMEVVQDLTCPICLEFYAYPIILPCSHVLCRRPCAENIFEVNFIRCPVCRDNCYITGGITSLPRVIPLESIIEKVRAERKKRAGVRISTSSLSQSDISLESVQSSGLHLSCTDLAPPTPSTKSPSAQSSARFTSPQSQPGADHSTPRHSQGLRSVSLACNQLLDDYQRIMRNLDNPPHVSSLLRNRNQSLYSSPSDSHASVDRSPDLVGSALTNQLAESPFSATPTNDIMSESTLTVDREIEDILHVPYFNLTNFQVFSPSQSTLRVSNPATISGVSNSLPCHPVSPNIRSSQVDDIAEHEIVASQGVEPCIPGDTTVMESDLSVSSTIVADDSLENPEAVVLQHAIQRELSRLYDVQCHLLLYLTSYRESVQRVQSDLHQDKCEVTSELDSLLAEIEARRNYLEEGVRGTQNDVIAEADDVTAATEKLLASTQRLASFADRALTAQPDVLLQTGHAVLEKLSSSVKTCELCLETSEPSLRAILNCNRYRVDFRRQKQALRELNFLEPPHPPVIDLRQSSRGNDTVALVLNPCSAQDIVDSYRISYCSEEQKYIGIEETVTYHTQPSESPELGEDNPSSEEEINSCEQPTLTFVLIEHLCSSTRYYFRACAVNRAGQGRHSDLVQCVTLSREECVVPVPSILENLTHALSPTSAKIVSHSPATVSPHQGVVHFLLRRPVGGACVWKGEEFQRGREEITVKGLQSGTEYQFLVMACNVRGEGQVSQKISLSLNEGSRQRFG